VVGLLDDTVGVAKDWYYTVGSIFAVLKVSAQRRKSRGRLEQRIVEVGESEVRASKLERGRIVWGALADSLGTLGGQVAKQAHFSDADPEAPF
jgi:hypothetical protein